MIQFTINQTCLQCSIYLAERNKFTASDSLHLVAPETVFSYCVCRLEDPLICYNLNSLINIYVGP